MWILAVWHTMAEKLIQGLKDKELNLPHTLQHRRMAWVDARECVIRLHQAVNKSCAENETALDM